MLPSDLQYEKLQDLIASYKEKQRDESSSFLNWFLENIYRLDPIEADDCICDRPNDRGVDGLYVDHTQNLVYVLQAKIRQRESSLGDNTLRDLAGTLTQFSTEQSVEQLLAGGGNEELKNLLKRYKVSSLIGNGYEAIGVFVSNLPLDENGKQFVEQHGSIEVYDRNKIASEYIELEKDGGVESTFEFDLSYVQHTTFKTGEDATTYILPVQALELVQMEGIEDGTLFSQNVRSSLGNTKVNKALKTSVLNPNEHSRFALYHNGVNILCKDARLKDDKLVIENYVVVNGAQSISTFKKSQEHLTPDLRIIAKIIKLNDASLAREITINSNNQNAIRPRDLKSTNDVQLRLKREFANILDGSYDLEIKRGEELRGGAEVISNEEAGRLLLAFDLNEPENCHQVYKLFDEKYSDIFARPAVTAYRIIFLKLLMDQVLKVANGIEYKPISKYGLTRFFLLSTISELIQSDEVAFEFYQHPEKLFEKGIVDQFMDAVEQILAVLVVDLNFEIEDRGDALDYKSDFKSATRVKELRSALIRSYKREVARRRTRTLGELINQLHSEI